MDDFSIEPADHDRGQSQRLSQLFEANLGPSLCRDVVDDFRRTDNCTVRIDDWRNRQQNTDNFAIFSSALRFVSVNPLAASDPGEDVLHLARPRWRSNHLDGPANHFERRITEYPLGGWIPARDDAVEGLGNDGGLGGMHDRGEQLRCECVGKSGWPPRSFVGSGAGLGFRDAPARWRFLGFFGQRSGLVVSGCSA
ncbi:MAG TPA: hypothetical protein VN766_16945 [Stellaceae bacterium]|nr:hypothetical protein [Stellaceae bacterium]